MLGADTDRHPHKGQRARPPTHPTLPHLSPHPIPRPQPVNVVRFSPDGLTLASAGDDGSVIIWKDQGDRAGGGEYDVEPEVAVGALGDAADLFGAPEMKRGAESE